MNAALQNIIDVMNDEGRIDRWLTKADDGTYYTTAADPVMNQMVAVYLPCNDGTQHEVTTVDARAMINWLEEKIAERAAFVKSK